MTPRTDRPHLLALVKEHLAVMHALFVLTGGYRAEHREDFERMRAELPAAGVRKLQWLHGRLAYDIMCLSGTLQSTRPFREYVDLVARMDAGDGQPAHLAKWELKALFRRYETCVSGVARFPEHVLITMDSRGVLPAGAPTEVWCLEAAQFEDMCSHFNRAWALLPAARAPGASKCDIKDCAAARRATVTTAVAVLETYLNSLADDHLRKHADGSPSRHLDRLREWNRKDDCPRWESFRNKLLQYPRIVLGLDHPPLLENNCRDLAYVLNESKLFRDAVVHAGPRPDVGTPDRDKPTRFWRLGGVTPFAYGRPVTPADLEACDDGSGRSTPRSGCCARWTRLCAGTRKARSGYTRGPRPGRFRWRCSINRSRRGQSSALGRCPPSRGVLRAPRGCPAGRALPEPRPPRRVRRPSCASHIPKW